MGGGPQRMVFCSLLVMVFGAPARITGPLASMRPAVGAPFIWPTLAASPTTANTIAQRRLRTTTLRCVVRPAVYMEWLIARPLSCRPARPAVAARQIIGNGN